LGGPNSEVKQAIFGKNSARIYHYSPEKQKALTQDAVSSAKAHYDQFGDGRTNLRYGYMQT
jgi:hypothetical protein